MSEDSVYHDADVVWVKLGTSWWPGEVCGFQRQPKDLSQLTKRKPYCVVKFFQEESFELVKSSKHILPFNCSKKDEFIRKGHELFKAKNKFMEKFPSDVSTAERLTRSVTRSSLFFNSRPDSIVKAILGESPAQIDCTLHGRRCDNVTKIINITRNLGDSPSSSSSPTYKCSLCDFQSNRQNVMVLHRKSHSNNTTTTNKNSVVNVNDSKMTPQNKMESKSKSTTKAFVTETFKSPEKKILIPKPVNNLTNSLLPKDAAAKGDESNYRSQQNIAKVDIDVTTLERCLLPINNDLIDLVQSTVGRTKQSNANQSIVKNKETCKSEDIQRSFLAEWIDDDEDVLQNSKEKKTARNNEAGSEFGEGNQMCQPVSDHTHVTSSEIQKPLAKIRNIPKKDRRNIVFTDFKNGEDLPQQSIDDVSLKIPLAKNVSLNAEHTSVAMILSAAELLNKQITGETCTTKKLVEPQNMELSDAGSSTQLQSSLLQEPNATKELFTNPTKTKTLKLKSHLVDCYTATPLSEETHIEVPHSEELSVIKPSNSYMVDLCIVETSVEVSPTVEVTKLFSPITPSPFTEANKVEESIVKACPLGQCVDKSLRAEALDLQTPATKPSTKTTTVIQSSTVESLAKEQRKNDQSAKKNSKNEVSAESFGYQSIDVNELALNSSIDSLKTNNLIVERSTIEFPKEKTAPKLLVNIPSLAESGAEVITKSIGSDQYSLNPSGKETQLSETAKDKPSMDETLVTLSTCQRPLVEKPIGFKPLAENLNAELSTEILSTKSSSAEESITLILASTASNIIQEYVKETTQTNENSEQSFVIELPRSVQTSMLEAPCQAASASVLPKEPTDITSGEVSTLRLHRSASATSVELSNKPPVIDPEVEDQLKSTFCKTFASVNKPSLSCFDFEEEEDTDILTSIAKFKKKYISSEKNIEYGKESQPRIPNSQNLEMELKDKQLSAEIESLLKTTSVPIEFAGASTSTERTITNEVRGLPIKERGKRIFKSRNRFKLDSCSSVSTTTTMQVKPENVASLGKTLDREQETRSIKTSTVVEKQDMTKKNHLKKNKLPVDAPSTKEETVDYKVTNSEEEVVGRVVFSPAEVYAPSAEFIFNEFADNKEGLVSSSGMGAHIEPLLTSVEKQTPIDLQSHLNSHNNGMLSSSFDKNLETIYMVMKESEVRAADSCIDDEEVQTSGISGILAIDKHDDNVELEESSKEKQQDNLNSFFVVEESEPIYEVEIYDADLNNKQNVSNIETTSDYDLITTEVTSIVDKIIGDDEVKQTEEKAKEIVPIVTAKETTDIVTCISNERKLEEITSADNIQLAFHKTHGDIIEPSEQVNPEYVATENSSDVLKNVEDRDASNHGQTDESNSYTTIDTHSKSSYPEKGIPVESFEDESRQTEVERAEASSDDTSTVISDAEAEFGSPTSMLEEERVLKRGKSESEMKLEDTNLTKVKEHLDKINRKDFRKSKVQLQNYKKETSNSNNSLYFDTQECTSNIFENKSSRSDHNEKTLRNLTTGDRQLKVMEGTELELHESKIKQLYKGEKYDFDEKGTSKNTSASKNKERTLLGKDFLGPNSESDSGEDDEEEICSPPIESLLDESRDGDNSLADVNANSKLEIPGNDNARNQENFKLPTENCEEATQTSITTIYSKNLVQITDFKTALSINSENQHPQTQTQELKTHSNIESKVSPEHDQGQMLAIPKEIQISYGYDKTESNDCAFSTFYTITQKSDTIIKLNKFKETLTKTESDTIYTESEVASEQLSIAGEELSAAEALLLIPNQSSNMLGNSKDSLNTKSETSEFSQVHGIKEEILDNMEQMSQLTDQKPIDTVRRKRRSHLKVTPRKRVIDVQNSEELVEPRSAQMRAKVPKLIPDPKDALLKQGHEIGGTTSHTKTFAEQYEDNFVLKYMKEQLVDDVDLVESPKTTTFDSDKSPNLIGKPSLEKVHITVDISNPLSSQIASILGTSRPSITETTSRVSSNKRKQTLEDDIPSFIIKRPNPKTVAEAEAADRETIAQIQNLCPHVEITRKPSRDDSITPTTSLLQSTKPHIINQQILRSGNQQPAITVTTRPKNLEEGIFDISNMPIVLSDETITNEKLHIVQVVKQFQNQKSNVSNLGSSSGNFSPIPVNITSPGIPVRRPSSVRTKRTPSRQQLQEQQNQEQQPQNQQKIQENTSEQPENKHHIQHQEYRMETQQLQKQHQHLEQLHQHHMRTQNHPQHQSQLQTQQQRQVQLQHQIEQQEQYQFHHQQQFLEDQQIIQQQQQQLNFQQPQFQIQQQVTSSEKVNSNISAEKQMGVDSRGNKYVIIKAPSNTVLMGNSPEQNKGLQCLQHLSDNKISITQRMQRQSASGSKKAASHQAPHSLQVPPNHLPLSMKSPQHQLPVNSQLPSVSIKSPLLQLPPPLPNNQIHNSPAQMSENNLNETAIISNLVTSPTKPKGQGRGRKAKQSNHVEAVSKEQTCKNVRTHTNGKRSSGSICDIPRQRSTRSANTNKKNIPMACSDVHQSVGSNLVTPPMYTTTQQTQSVVYMTCPQSITSPSSPILSCTNNMPHQVQHSNQRCAPQVITGIPIETSDGLGVGYAVPSLPVPGYPQTFLLCELIDKKYREVYPKPLYLSEDRTRFFEVPDNLVTEAHRKLTDCRREPNPDVLEVVSAGIQHVLQPKVDISTKTIVSQLEDDQKFRTIDFTDNNVPQDDILMQKNETLSMEEQASALLCLQEQITQEQIVQEQFVQEHRGHEQLVQEQLAQEQLVQEQFAQEQFVQDQFMQQQIDAEHGILQVATIETEEVQDNIIQHLEPDSVVMEESVETTRTMLINLADQQIIVDQNVFFDAVGHENIGILSSDSNTYTLSPEAVQALLNSLYGHRNITTSTAFGTKVCEQQHVVMNENMLQPESPSADVLTVALDDTDLYSEEQFINAGDILQIESADDLQLIGNAAESTNIVFKPMTTLIPAKTSETNVLLNQAPKMSTVEIPSDNKPKFEADTSATATLEGCLNVIGLPVQSPIIPASLELPTSVTNSAIVAKMHSPNPGSIIAAGVCHHPDITSLPPISSTESELHYEFFSPSTGSHANDAHASEESEVADMGAYTVVSNGGNFDDPGR